MKTECQPTQWKNTRFPSVVVVGVRLVLWVLAGFLCTVVFSHLELSMAVRVAFIDHGSPLRPPMEAWYRYAATGKLAATVVVVAVAVLLAHRAATGSPWRTARDNAFLAACAFMSGMLLLNIMQGAAWGGVRATMLVLVGAVPPERPVMPFYFVSPGLAEVGIAAVLARIGASLGAARVPVRSRDGWRWILLAVVAVMIPVVLMFIKRNDPIALPFVVIDSAFLAVVVVLARWLAAPVEPKG